MVHRTNNHPFLKNKIKNKADICYKSIVNIYTFCISIKFTICHIFLIISVLRTINISNCHTLYLYTSNGKISPKCKINGSSRHSMIRLQQMDKDFLLHQCG